MKIKLLALLCLTVATFSAQTGVGAKYGTRDPRVCASTKEPAKGPISTEKAKEYVTCGYDRDRTSVAGELWLVDVQQIEVGKPRAFQIREDLSEADPSQLVYPIRGKQIKYICSQVQNRAPGKNCQRWEIPDATGTCFRTSFGDWKCNLPGGQGVQATGVGPR